MPFIRHLHLREQPWDETLPLLLGFESIRSLSVDDLYFHRLGSPAVSALFHNFSAVVDLRLEDVRFATTDELIHLICAFPCLQKLAIHRTRPFRGPNFKSSTPTTFGLSPHLRVLELDSVCMDQVLDWFLSLPDPPALHTVALRPWWNSDFETIARLLLALENSLETFFIFTSFVHDGMFVSFLNLIHAEFQVRIELAIRPVL